MAAKTEARKRRILIVDDEPDLNTLFRMALEEAGFKVYTYGDPEEALSDFKPGTFDLAILDIKMPKMDGFKLHDEIKKKDSNAKICFITASESYYEEYRRREYDSMEKDMFIRKPISNKELVERINRLLAEKND